MQHAMLFGLELGVWFAIGFMTQTHASTWYQVLHTMVEIYILFGVYRSAVNYRETECDGVVRYGESVRYIIQLYFYAGVISALICLVYLLWMNPGYLAEQQELVIRVFEENGMNITDEMRASMKELLVPSRYAMMSIFGEVLRGIVVGMLMGILVSRRGNRSSMKKDMNNN